MQQSNFVQQFNQQNALKVQELKSLLNFPALQTLQISSKRIEDQIPLQKYIFLILNTSQSEQEISFIRFFSDNQAVQDSNLLGVSTFTYVYQGVYYYFIQVNPNIQLNLNVDIANSSWLNLLFSKCQKLWVIVTQSYQQFMNDGNDNFKRMTQLIDFFSQFFCLTPQQISPDYSLFHYFFMHNRQVDKYTANSNNQLKRMQLFYTDQKQFAKQEFAKYLQQFNNDGKLLILHNQDSKLNIMQRLTFLNSTLPIKQQQITQQILQLPVLYQLSINSNNYIQNIITKIKENAQFFMQQKDFTQLKEILDYFYLIICFVKNANYYKDFQKLCNYVQYLLLTEIMTFLAEFQRIIQQGQGVQEQIINYLQSYIFQLTLWQQKIVEPFFQIHKIPIEITKEVFENEIAKTFKNKLDQFRQHNSETDIEQYSQVLLALRKFSQQSMIPFVKKIYDDYVLLYDQLIHERKTFCLNLINEIFTTFKYSESNQLSQILGQILTFSKLIQMQEQLVSQIKFQSHRGTDFDMITIFKQALKKYINQTTQETVQVIKMVKNPEYRMDISEDVAKLKQQFNLLENILCHVVRFGLQDEQNDFNLQIIQFSISECSNYMSFLLKDKSLFSSVKHIAGIQFNLQNLLRFLKGVSMRIYEKCQQFQQLLMSSIYTGITGEVNQILEKIVQYRKQESSNVMNSIIYQQQSFDEIEIQDIYLKIQSVTELYWIDKELGTCEISLQIKKINTEVYELIRTQILYISTRINNPDKFKWVKIGESFKRLGLYSSKITQLIQKQQSQTNNQNLGINNQSDQKILQEIQQTCLKVHEKVQSFQQECKKVVQNMNWQKLVNIEEQEKYVQYFESYIFSMQELKQFHQRNKNNPLYDNETQQIVNLMLGESQKDQQQQSSGYSVAYGNGVEKDILTQIDKFIKLQIALIPDKEPQKILTSDINLTFGIELLRLIIFFQLRKQNNIENNKLQYDFIENLQLQTVEQEVKNKLTSIWDYFYKIFAISNNNNSNNIQNQDQQNVKVQKVMKSMSENYKQFFPLWQEKFNTSTTIMNEFAKIGYQLNSELENLYYNANSNREKFKEVIQLLLKIQEFKMKKSSIIIPQLDTIEKELNNQIFKVLNLYENKIKTGMAELNFKEMESYYLFYRNFHIFEKEIFLQVFNDFTPSILINQVKGFVQNLQVFINLKDDQVKIQLKKIVKSLFEVVTYNSELPLQSEVQQQQQSNENKFTIRFDQDKSLTEMFYNKLVFIIQEIEKQTLEIKKEFNQLLENGSGNNLQAETLLSIFKFISDQIYKPPTINFDQTLQVMICEKNTQLIQTMEIMKNELKSNNNSLVNKYIKKIEDIKSLENLQSVDQEIAKLKISNAQLFSEVLSQAAEVCNQYAFKIEQELSFQNFSNIPIALNQLYYLTLIRSIAGEDNNRIKQKYQELHEKVFTNIVSNLSTFAENVINQNFAEAVDDKQILSYLNIGQIVLQYQSNNNIKSSQNQANNMQLQQQQVQVAYQKLQTINKEIFEQIKVAMNQYHHDMKSLNIIAIDQSLNRIKSVDAYIKFFKSNLELDVVKQVIDKTQRDFIQQANTVITYAQAQAQVQNMTTNLQQSYNNAWETQNYKELTKIMNIIVEYQKVIKNHSIKGTDIIDYQTKLDEISKKIQHEAELIVKQFAQIATVEFQPKLGKQIQITYASLAKIRSEFQHQSDLKNIIEGHLQFIKQQLIQFHEPRKLKIKALLQQQVEVKSNEIGQLLIEIVQIGYHVSDLQQTIFDLIDNACLNEIEDVTIVFSIDTYFKEINNIVANFIVENSETFKNVKIGGMLEITQTQNTPEYVLSKMSVLSHDNVNYQINKNPISEQAKKSISDKFNNYDEKFQQILQKYISQLQNKHELKTVIFDYAKLIQEKNNLEENTQNLLIYLAAYWTLFQIKNNKPMRNKQGQFIFKVPHASQAFAIMFLLNFDNPQKLQSKDFLSQLQSHLIQIKTGEGKSILLGMLSSYLSLIGYSVDVVCYSQYLSERDYLDFLDFFQALKVDEYVKYSTFTKLSDDIINQKGNIRDLSLKVLNDGNNQQQLDEQQQQQQLQKINNLQRPRVLLIDEVDVFFNKDFYGKTYNPMVQFKTKEVSYIMNEVWNNRLQPTQQILDEIFNSEQYRVLIEQHQPVKELLNMHVRMMVDSVKKIDSETDYEVITIENNVTKIGYKQPGQISTSIYKGYLTNFTYFKEFENMRISKEEKENNTCINLSCGFYSYASAPFEYKLILGVTGTLETMHPESVKIISRYVQKMTEIPSMYGKSNLQFNKSYGEDILILPDIQEYFRQIKQIAKEKSQANRAVLIFFQDNERLQAFKKTDERFCTLIIDQNCPKEELKDRINQATTKNQIVLVDRIFGRGTDFICRDPEVKNNNGVVVIQTFISLDKSEEIQIQGRTARQSQKGQYYMILHVKDVKESFKINDQQITPLNNTIYDQFIEKYRKIAYGNELQELNTNIEKAKDKHTQTVKYQEYLVNNNKALAIQQLINFNLKVQPIHFILILDDSGSMQLENRWTNLMTVTNNFIDSQLARAGNGPGPNIFSVIFYSYSARKIAEYTPITNLRQIVANAVPEYQQTYFHKATELLYNILDNEPQQYRSFQKKILFLTDGEDGEQAEQGQLLGKKLLISLQKILNQFSQQIRSWKNILIGSDVKNTQALENFAQKMINCGGQFIKAGDLNQLEEEFNNFGNDDFFNL